MSAIIRQCAGARATAPGAAKIAPHAARTELDVARPAGRPERHVARPASRTPSSASRPVKRRIRRLVVDDEPGIDGDRPVRRLDGDRLDVAADGGIAFEQPDLVVLAQGVRGGQPADPGTHDRDLMPRPACRGRYPVAPGARARAARRAFAASLSGVAPQHSRSARPKSGSMRRRTPPSRISAV